MSSSVQFWDRIAEKYARSPVGDPAAYDYTLERVRSYLGPEDRVLELGCGTGTTALRLRDAVACYTASDVAPAMIAIAQQKKEEASAANLRFVVSDVVGAPEETFDAVLGFNLFHLVGDLDAALAQVHRRIRPGGLFISKTPCLKDSKSGFQRLMMRVMIPVMQLVGKAPSVVHFMAIKEWQARIEAAGFEVVETGNSPATPPNRFIVARRR